MRTNQGARPADFAVACPATGQPCVMNCAPHLKCMEQEIERILRRTPAKIHAEHLAHYDGDQQLADKSIDMMRAMVQKMLGERWKQ